MLLKVILSGILSGLVSLNPAEKKVVSNLQTRLKRDGHDISQYLGDSRFEIYRFKGGGKATNYADTTQSWYMKADSIEKCADFIDEYYYWLKKVEDEFGPSPEHITSQLQLETNRGQYTGERPVINSLISVYLHRPSRRNEFYKYMKDFFDLVDDTTDNIILPKDIFEIKGSWAGAHGVAQMMPSILKKYGKISDFEGDSLFDPMNIPDAIGFVGRYLSDNGFERNKLGAIQRYNQGDPFYGSSIGKHTEKLTKIMEKRRRIPPKKIAVITNRPLIHIEPVKADKLQHIKHVEIIVQLPEKQPFIKRIILNRKIGKK